MNTIRAIRPTGSRTIARIKHEREDDDEEMPESHRKPVALQTSAIARIVPAADVRPIVMDHDAIPALPVNH